MRVDIAEGCVRVHVGELSPVHTDTDAQRVGLWAVRQAMAILRKAEQQIQNPQGEPFIMVAHTKG